MLLSGALLFGSAVFNYAWRTQLITALLLFLPLLHKPFVNNQWSFIKGTSYKNQWGLRISIIGAIGLLVFVYPSQLNFAVGTLLFTALPEEWFFRAYALVQIESLLSKGLQTRQQRETLPAQGAQYKHASLTQYSSRILERLNTKHTANIISACFFALLHLPTQGLQGLSVFFPSLFFGWLYQRNHDLVLTILTHSLFNLLFVIYIQAIIANFF